MNCYNTHHNQRDVAVMNYLIKMVI